MNPGLDFEITERAYAINGISKNTLLGRRRTKEVLTSLIDFWASRCGKRTLLLVGHNVRTFDLPLLKREMKRVGMKTNPMLSNAQCIDTLHLLKDKKVWSESDEFDAPPAGSFNLGGLYEHVFGRELPDAHSAMGDIKGNAELWLRMDPTMKRALATMKPAKLNE